jgi:flagellar hook assembly protein FlgD
MTATAGGTTVMATATPTKTPGVSGTTPTATATVYIKYATGDTPVVVRQNVIRPSENRPVVIGVHLAEAQHVAIRIYTQTGKLVKVLEDRMVEAGTFEAVWSGVNQNGSVVRSGVYLVEIQTAHFTEKRKVVVVR